MSVYYNEHDPKAAAWLRELMWAGAIPLGYVDERNIQDVEPDDVCDFAQCHFFAGIGGWAYALQLAGWPTDRPVWTGSCPCQSFSSAGKHKHTNDDRHLWPYFGYLIGECQPPVVFGEQVASKAALAWWDLVSDDLEGAGYTTAAADLCAASVGAPHIRQRLYWVAHRLSPRLEIQRQQSAREECATVERGGEAGEPLEYSSREQVGISGCTRIAGDAGSELADADGRLTSDEHLQRSGRHGQQSQDEATSFWSPCSWLPCRDGKWRPVEPGTFPLAHGLPARVGRLRGYGNAIVPQVAAAFIEAYVEACDGVASR